MGLFRRLFGPRKKADKKTSRSSTPSSHKFNETIPAPYSDPNSDANKHAIAVAAATAAVAEAALAAAQAAAEVVRLTNAGAPARCAPASASTSTSHAAGGHRRWLEVLAAIRIQSAFRGYLARRALRALKALVKLQALVRGHIVRKQTADMLRRMQTLVRLQARARAGRSHLSEPWHSATKLSHSHYTVPAGAHKDYLLRASSTKLDGPSNLQRCGSNANFRDIRDRSKLGPTWLDHWMEESLWNNHSSSPLRNRQTDDEKSDKILEVDTWMPRVKSHQGNRGMSQHVLPSDNSSQSFTALDSPSKLPRKMSNPMPSVPSEEGLPLNSLKLPLGKEETVCSTADHSPHVDSASSRPGSNSRKGPFTPTRSECSWGFFNGYSGYPSYMANTESSRAKVRSQSAPRQRVEFDKYGLAKRSLQGYGDADTYSEIGFAAHTQFRNKAYQASGYLNRLDDRNIR
ncbi:hypothetical protein Tsubulata_034566 [Turnera subulata]|uniref:DUF4005 domain-containing protein n=1 Tax=Turnera subulata TaxID=218843 RepID=A0A9Q0FAK3_9ROSI|nr:hypothetical protein Tsubulata_034566 [Turnera subulata]